MPESIRKSISLTKKVSYDELVVNPDGTICDMDTRECRTLVLRHLVNDGFSNDRVRCLKPLITNGYSFEQIKELFNKDSDIEDIQEFVKQMGIA